MTTKGTKRKLTAILSADVEGYSRLMSQDEFGTIRTLTAYREAIGGLIQHYRGRVVDSPGDNLLAEFASVVDAVNCAVEIQRELAEGNAELPYSRKMEFRIGVNLGDVVEEEGRIYGDGVNIAARVESLAEGGGICISGTVHDHVKDKLGLEYESLGEQTVKNIPEPVRVYRVLSFPGAAARKVIIAKKEMGKRWAITGLVVVGFLVVGVAAVFIWNSFLRPTPPEEAVTDEPPALELPDKPSIAVLPFANLSDDPAQEYFADGMTDDLITDLSKMSGLFVISRNSVFTYKGKPVKADQISQELGVRYLVEGSVRRAGQQVRINVQLIDATTDSHLWAERYDGQMEDIFGLQDRINEKIVSALGVKLTAGEQEQVARKDTDNTVAYDAFLQGWEHYLRFTSEDFAKALSSYKKAIELDPNYSRAYAAIAQLYWAGSIWGWQHSLGVSSGVARLLAGKYLESSSENPTSIAHVVASSMFLCQYQHEEAVAEAERAVALDPNDPGAHDTLGWALIYAGRAKEAVDCAKAAMRLDPHNPAVHLLLLGFAHFCMGQLEEAVTSVESACTYNPQICGYWILAPTYAHLGREEEARDAMENHIGKWPEANLRWLMYYFPFKDTEVAHRFADGLLKAGLSGQPSGYYKISKEHKLTGEEIRTLWFGRRCSGMHPAGEWWVDCREDGNFTCRAKFIQGGSDSGKNWIEDDKLYFQWRNHLEGLRYYGHIYRNPEGTSEMKDEYLYVSFLDLHPFSQID